VPAPAQARRADSSPFDPDRGWRLHPQVAVRPEPFGALLYHFGTRKLSFLKNRTILTYARRTAPVDDADRANCENMINFLRDVTYGDDYVLGMKIQKGLESGAVDNITFGKNERGNQFFHEIVDWYLAADPSKPMPVM